MPSGNRNGAGGFKIGNGSLQGTRSHVGRNDIMSGGALAFRAELLSIRSCILMIQKLLAASPFRCILGLVMSRTTRSTARISRRQSTRSNGSEVHIKQEETPAQLPKQVESGGSTQQASAGKKRPQSNSTTDRKAKKIKSEPDEGNPPSQPQLSPVLTPKTESQSPSGQDLRVKKLKAYAQFAKQSPFPEFHRPTPSECKLAHRILSSLHGPRTRPTEVVAPTARAGCGDSPSVLDALVRTILSQNTSDANSTRAKQSMDRAYGRSDKWSAIAAGGKARLQEAIKCGGLAATKSRVIISILRQVEEKYGTYSLDHLHGASDEAAMREMLAFQGVGPKTASCVLLFCLRRASFAVDTHVWRITGLLGWRPRKASRDETHAHLEARVPDEDKYGLHILLVTHGKRCEECKAGGKSLGKCELRKAFVKGQQLDEVDASLEVKLKEELFDDEAGQDLKKEDI